MLGPPRSGKTSSVVVPNVFAAAGAVVAVSTKRDVMNETSSARARLGECLLFDPSGTVEVPRHVRPIGWSPLTRLADVGRRCAHGRVDGRGESRKPRPDRRLALDRESGRTSRLRLPRRRPRRLPTRRRHLGGEPEDPERFVSALARHDADLALDLLFGITETEEREQSAIWSTASGVLAGYRTGAALASAGLEHLDPGCFVQNRSTLFVAAPAEYQRHLAPLVAGVIRDVRTAAYRRNAAASPVTGPPVLLVLDELANIAPLHDLPSLVAEGASQGVVTLASLQDISQARARFGTAADGFLTLFGVKLVLAGMSDVRTLEALSALAGTTRRGRPLHDVRPRRPAAGGDTPRGR